MGNTWAVVLAAGEGSRLRSVTATGAGDYIPKQFCSLRGGRSLLHEALRRAESVAAPQHICVVVAEGHRRWWEKSLKTLSAANVIVQPRNCGTANGILLPVLHILERDPEARIVLLPSDHHVSDEPVLAAAMQRAVKSLKQCRQEIVLLGIEPDEADAELGYIVPGGVDTSGLSCVRCFVEKPSAERAQELLSEGALWNTFIVAATGRALLETFESRYPDIVATMRAVVAYDAAIPQRPIAAAHAYEFLPDMDFSRHVIQGLETGLRVLSVPRCGWNDLGTPSRVAATLQRVPTSSADPQPPTWAQRGHLNLSERFF